jgi:hypothetical protein
MSVVTVIKKIATKIVSIVTYPFRAAHQVHAILETGVQDFPATKAAIVYLAKQFEVLGSDALHAIADKGLDFKADLETLADIKALFQFFETEFLPVIEKDFADLKPLISEAEAVPAPGSVPLPQIAAAVLLACITWFLLKLQADFRSWPVFVIQGGGAGRFLSLPDLRGFNESSFVCSCGGGVHALHCPGAWPERQHDPRERIQGRHGGRESFSSDALLPVFRGSLLCRGGCFSCRVCAGCNAVSLWQLLLARLSLWCANCGVWCRAGHGA